VVLEAFDAGFEFHQVEHRGLRVPDAIDRLEAERIAEGVGERFALDAREGAEEGVLEERPYTAMDADDFVQPHRIEFAEDAGKRGVVHGAFDGAFLLGLKFET
jgi:hypothetical protein